MKMGLRSISEIISAGDCTGCSACYATCPHGAISMTSNEKGFYKPDVNENLCIHCNCCIYVCPNNTDREVVEELPTVYACRAKDEEIQKESASGGFFFILACDILNSGGVVYGASFDETFSVCHVAIEDISELWALQGSKYVQSSLGDSFKEIEEFLKNGRLVLFSGTPCQVSGLLSYLGGARENLVTVDVICHGTPSPKIWQNYLHARFLGERVKGIDFRYKKRNDQRDYFPLMFQTDKRVLLQKYEDNEFIKGFIANLYLKDSCYHCRFKGVNRESDLTIGDFWGIDSVQPGFSNGLGTSLIFVHTQKGKCRFDSIRGELVHKEILPEKIDQIVLYNSSISYSSLKTDKYDEFWEEYSTEGFLKTINRLTRKPVGYYISRVKHDVKYAVYLALKPLLKKREDNDE